MKEIVLDERLAAVASMVREGSVVADIGCDHGLLVCHLVESRRCPRAYACDINEGPLSRARQNIRGYGLDSRILAVRTDGLRGIPAENVDDVVIAGMGGDLIARLLWDWDGCKEAGKLFVLQPMSKPEHLRMELYRKGFVILEEKAVACGSFVYLVMTAEYTGACVEISRFFSWTGKLWEQEMCEANFSYLVGVHELLCKKAEGYAKSGKDPLKALEYADMAERILGKLEESKGA